MRAVFFDRDGIVNIPPPAGDYIRTASDFHLMPDFPALLQAVLGLGYVAVVTTNQRCIARGLVSRETVECIHTKMRRLLRDEYGLALLDVLYCPHDPGECACRKPLPGMLLEAARRHGIDLGLSWMIGDRATDVEAGRRAGCRAILVNAGTDVVNHRGKYFPDMVCRDLKDLRQRIETLLGAASKQ